MLEVNVIAMFLASHKSSLFWLKFDTDILPTKHGHFCLTNK